MSKPWCLRVITPETPPGGGGQVQEIIQVLVVILDELQKKLSLELSTSGRIGNQGSLKLEILVKRCQLLIGMSATEVFRTRGLGSKHLFATKFLSFNQ